MQINVKTDVSTLPERSISPSPTVETDSAPSAVTPPFQVQWLAALNPLLTTSLPQAAVTADAATANAGEPRKKTSPDDSLNQQWMDALLQIPTMTPGAFPPGITALGVPSTFLPTPLSSLPTSIVDAPVELLPQSAKPAAVLSDPLAEMQIDANKQPINLTPALASTRNLLSTALPSFAAAANRPRAIDIDSGSAINRGSAINSGSPILTETLLNVGALAPSPLPMPAANAPSSTEASLKLQGNGEQWAQQLGSALGERLKLQIDNNVQHATIRLDPAEMGKIDISLHVEAGKLSVQITAGQQDVYRALQQTSNELRQNLLQHNVQVDVNVSSNSHPQQQASQHSQKQSSQHAFHPQAEDIFIARTLTHEENSADSDGTILMTI